MTMREDKWPGTKKATKHTQCIFQHLESKYIQVFTLFTKIELCKGFIMFFEIYTEFKRTQTILVFNQHATSGFCLKRNLRRA